MQIKEFSEICNIIIACSGTCSGIDNRPRIFYKDIGYKGSQPNIWYNSQQEVLEQHNIVDCPKWVAQRIDQNTLEDIATQDIHKKPSYIIQNA